MTGDITTVCVSLEDREDGGLRVFSDDLPGLILSGSNPLTVVNKIAPAIVALFKAAKGLNVSVRSAKPISEILDGKNPQKLDMNVQKCGESTGRAMPFVHTKVFVVELRQAA